VASPIAHTFAGVWTSLLLTHQLPYRALDWWRPYLPKLLVLIFLANLPDLDFVMELGFRANELHRGFSHSLLAAVLVSVALGFVWRIVPSFWRSVLLYFAAYGWHLLIDICTGTHLGWTHTGYGIPLFWPWQQQFASPLILAFGVRHANSATLFSIDNLRSCIYELFVCSAVTIVLLILWKQKRNSRIIPIAPKPTSPILAEIEAHK
jgi:membrane-bound metal-dependent hydrolase YbcI (DUF457 family)